MAVKLHCCGAGRWLKIQGHPCWRVESALREQGVAYEPVYGPLSSRKRDELERVTGQRRYPVIEFDDGSIYRAESKEMRATIMAGKLDEKRASPD